MFKRAFAILAISVVVLAQPVWAAKPTGFGLYETWQETGGLIPEKIAGGGTIPEIIGNVVAVALSLVGIAFFLLALYSGFIWMKAMGNTESVTKAKDILEAAIIGLVLVLAAYAISSFVFSKLSGSTVAGGGTTPPGPGTPVPNDPNNACCQRADGCSTYPPGGTPSMDMRVCANANGLYSPGETCGADNKCH